MNKEAILKHTTNYEDNLLDRLRDLELAQAYLEAAFDSYEKDGNTEALLLAMRDVAEAQGGIGQLAKRTAISRQHLYEILASKHNPRLTTGSASFLDLVFAFDWSVRMLPLNLPLPASRSDVQLMYWTKAASLSNFRSGKRPKMSFLISKSMLLLNNSC